MSTLNVNEILYITEGKRGNGVSHDRGKIVLFKNEVKRGYARITKVIKETDTYFLAEGENIPYDYYKGMQYAEFKEMLVARGYKIGYEQSFYNEFSPEVKQTQLFAYNMQNGIIIIADTFYEEEGYNVFNSIEVYVPHMQDSNADIGSYCNGYGVSTFNITHYRGSFVIDKLERKQRIQGGDNQWLYNIIPNMWNYTEVEKIKHPYRTLKLSEDIKISHFALQTAMKLNMVDKEIRELFKSNEKAQIIFAMIDEMNKKGIDHCEVKAVDCDKKYDKDYEVIYLYK